MRAWSPRRWDPWPVPGGPRVQVGEDPAGTACVVNDGEDIHARAAARSYEWLNLVGLADEVGPGPAKGQGNPVGIGNGHMWRRRNE